MTKLFSLDNYKDKDRVFQFSSTARKGLEIPVAMGIALSEAYAQKNHEEEYKFNGVSFTLDEKQKNYDDLNKSFITAMGRYMFRDETLSYESICTTLGRSGGLHRDEQDRYYDVINAVETVVTPAVTSSLTGMYNEVRNIALGDTAEFDVESNEILIPNKSAEGISFGGEKHLYRDTKTIIPTNLNISFSTDWYKVATGKADFGQMFYKASLGFANYLTYEAYNKLVALAAQLPAYCRYTGFTTENIDLATMATSGANGGARASIIGTLLALREVIPTNDFLKMGIGEEWVKMGYVGVHAGTPVVLMNNLINPATINSNAVAGTPSFLFSNEELFVLPFIGRKPIKTVFEGDMFTINKSSIETADKTERASLTYKVGVDYVFDELFAYIVKE